jgi:ATP-dependent DNA helicase RecQ
MLLRYFGDAAAPFTDDGVPCCDVCEPSLVPAAPAQPVAPVAASRRGGDASAVPGDLDDAIFAVVGSAEPAVGRTRAVEILCGGRSKVVEKYSYDGLPAYGAFAHVRRDDVLARVDELLAAGRLRSTGGRFPKLAAA